MRKHTCSKHVSGVGAVMLESIGMALALATTVVARFVSGRPMLREVGPADSTYLDWAPPAGAGLSRMRVAVPRTSWGRRPGWHRQLVRLIAVAIAVGLMVVPALTVATLGGAGVAGIAAVAWHHRDRAAAPRSARSEYASAPDVLSDAMRLQQLHGGNLDHWIARVLAAAPPSPRARAGTANEWRDLRADPWHEVRDHSRSPEPVYAQAERLDQGGVR